MFVRVDHASLQASDLSRSGLASQAEGRSWALWRGSGRALQPLHPLGGARVGREQCGHLCAALLNGLDMNSCAVDGLVVASWVPRWQ